MKDLKVRIGYTTRLEGSVGGNLNVIDDSFVTTEWGRKPTLSTVTVERADLEALVLGVFQFLPAAKARELVEKLKRSV